MGVNKLTRRAFCAFICFFLVVSVPLWKTLYGDRKSSSSPTAIVLSTDLSKKHDTRFVKKFSTYRTDLNRTLRILLWTTWFKEQDWKALRAIPMSSCPVSNCIFTSKKSELKISDAVLFHAPNTKNQLPRYHKPDQVWVLLSQESPPNTPHNFTKFGGLFNWTVTYRRSSDIFFPYFYLVKLPKQKLYVEDIASQKTHGILWVASNCQDQVNRKLIVLEINKHFPVDTFGKCGERNLPKNFNWIKYKFYLAFENSYCEDYITEKMWSALQRHQIPIVYGGADYKKLAPHHSIINIVDYESFEDLADYLRYLDKNNTAYNEYFEWTKEFIIARYLLHFCELCAALHDESRPNQVYTDIEGYIADDTCSRFKNVVKVHSKLQAQAIKDARS